ncbi:hypothetical protein KIN20_004330 [Parelaphostrongylus tenuis]|uniref:FAS1 domain-containing protein n=1 Tax=Parelaphostrongylus tenuis TaxID=148309 RepID=A0AAD5MGV2_PARTN|nr:hypothetical protein KIN20_004330 [Parelaphostrongylus tenuis]
MIVFKTLLLFLLVSSTSTNCITCSLQHDFDYGSSEEQRLEDSMNSIPRTRSASRVDHALVNSLARVSDLTSSLFGNFVELANQRKSQMLSNDVPEPLNTRKTTSKFSTKMEQNSNHEITNHLFNIFDKIGSGITRISYLERPHVCTRESTKKRPSPNNVSLKSEKICQRFRDAQKCIDRRTDAKGVVETTRVEECCEGYETRDIFNHGCPIESPTLAMDEVLQRMNSSLWHLAERSDAKSELSKNNITVFASTGKYTKQPSNTTSYILSRIVPGTYRAHDWTDGTVLKTIRGGDLIISQSDDGFGSVKSFVNCIPLNSSSHRTQNGIVHLVNGDLRPASETLFSTLEKDSRFAPFHKLLSDRLIELLPKTRASPSLFHLKRCSRRCPSHCSTISKPVKAVHQVSLPVTLWRVSVCSSELSHRRLKSLAGSEIDVQTEIRDGEAVTYVGRARLVAGDICTRNGIVHIIDDVLVGDEFLSWKEHLEIYNPDLNDALNEVLDSTNESVTILVPPACNKTMSAEMAKNHIVSGEVLEDFRRASTIQTDAKSVMFTGYSPRTSPVWVRISVQRFQRQFGQIGCTKIIRDSVRGCRSILHFIEKPLPLIVDSLETFLEKRKDLSKFNRLWRESSLNGSLTAKKPVTVFIPSDDALSNNEFKKLIANSKLSDIFVKRYIVAEPLCDFDIRPHPAELRIQTHANLNGEALRVKKLGDDMFINGAKIEESEIMLSNGVAYVLDSVISRKYPSRQPNVGPRMSDLDFLDIISYIGH